ncbi:hypothetical protein Y717_09640 [Streptomyces scopuliridis RB72]|uniref:Uncharacterized protein n=1 Tax=Streptomyces scopuliridis RB72 TaxID=1440053 RepID=A0A2T7SP87_9ACTN|nr:hypothetical protein Y717_09640 [Streptomyces scopuliridis RB72]
MVSAGQFEDMQRMLGETPVRAGSPSAHRQRRWQQLRWFQFRWLQFRWLQLGRIQLRRSAY